MLLCKKHPKASRCPGTAGVGVGGRGVGGPAPGWDGGRCHFGTCAWTMDPFEPSLSLQCSHLNLNIKKNVCVVVHIHTRVQ